jgi:hypothetical protein
MPPPTLVTARFYEPERHRLEQVVGPVEIDGFGSNGLTTPAPSYGIESASSNG